MASITMSGAYGIVSVGESKLPKEVRRERFLKMKAHSAYRERYKDEAAAKKAAETMTKDLGFAITGTEGFDIWF